MKVEGRRVGLCEEVRVEGRRVGLCEGSEGGGEEGGAV